VIATLAGRGTSLPPFGHRLDGLAADVEFSPGCWTERKSVLPSGVQAGPVISHSTGPLANW
jgi:hypothetical protein